MRIFEKKNTLTLISKITDQPEAIFKVEKY